MSPSQLYRFEQNLETSAQAALAALGIAASVSLGSAVLAAPYVALKAGTFTRASNQMAFSARNGPAFYNHFTGTLVIAIVTPRDNPGTGRLLHQQQLGTIRALMAQPRQALRIAGCDLLWVKPAAGTFTLQRDNEQDRSELVYDADIAIHGAAMDLSVV